MTQSEAIEKLKAHIECESKRSSIEGCNEGCIDCELAYLQGTSKEHIESVKLAIQALEKQIPKKPIFDYNLSDTLSKFHCECGNVIKVSHDTGIMNNNNAPNYCSKCGCRLDWSDGNDD